MHSQQHEGRLINGPQCGETVIHGPVPLPDRGEVGLAEILRPVQVDIELVQVDAGTRERPRQVVGHDLRIPRRVEQHVRRNRPTIDLQRRAATMQSHTHALGCRGEGCRRAER